eukprot:766294-Hanusia_phi.AAC.1
MEEFEISEVNKEIAKVSRLHFNESQISDGEAQSEMYPRSYGNIDIPCFRSNLSVRMSKTIKMMEMTMEQMVFMMMMMMMM